MVLPTARNILLHHSADWEYDGYEQQLHYGDKSVKLSTDYKANGEWKILDSTACSGILDSESEGPLGYLKVCIA